MTRAAKASRGLWVAATGLLWAIACVDERPELVIGSKSFSESRLLGEMLAQTMTAQRPELRVVRRLGLGGTKVAFEAVRSGEIDVYPEYTGTVWLTMLGEERTGDTRRVREGVRTRLGEEFNLTFLDPFGFENTYVLAVTQKAARVYDLRRISDLASCQDQIRAAFTLEFLGRPDGVPGLEEAYGIRFGNRKGVEHQLAYRALQSDEADLMEIYSTDGKLVNSGLVLLEDDRRFFPPYEAGWLASRDSLRRLPKVRESLEAFSGRIDAEQMRRWNFEVEEKKREIEVIAQEALAELNLPFEAPRSGQDRWRRDLGEVGRLSVEHVLLTVLSVLAAALVAIPTGVLLSRRPRLAEAIIGAVGVIQTIPSIALLAILIPLLGLGAGPALVTLFLYALLPILRNTTVGIRDVDPVLREASRGLGMTRAQCLRRLEFPLALPVIFAGLRTATVINIGTATLAAFVGAGGLGELIKAGLDLNSNRLILLGAVPAAVMAWGADWMLGWLETRVTPGPG